jgi:TrmH family RNA methyltransferase
MAERLSNAQAKFFARLRREKKIRDSEGLFVVEGERALKELIVASEQSLVALVLRESDATDLSLLPSKTLASKTFETSEKQFQQLSDTEQSQGIIGVFRQPRLSRNALIEELSRKEIASVLALDDIQDAGNLGTIIRSAAWFEFDAAIASSGTADFFNPKVARASAGSLFALPLLRVDSLAEEIEELKRIGFKCFGATLLGEQTNGISFEKKSLLVIGNEGSGISPEIKQRLDVQIRIDGNAKRVDSLNAAVSAGILMAKRYERLKSD